ncbi:hypothetical protein CLOP_g20614 [Closterium sp. NIES-67]|nr:hypothetical protein CLOP_g20614 [Closterium sp. NIES-67]
MDPHRPFELITDASDLAVGAVLLQYFGEGLQPIAYESRKLNPPEQNHHVHDKELLAIVHAFKVWRCYLTGGDMTIRTNHKSLKFIRAQPTLNPRPIRWLDYLESNFHYRVTYKRGVSNIADALTRPSVHTAAIWVPAYRTLCEQMIQEAHDSNFSGHYGIDKTAKSLCRNYYWPDLPTDVQQYVTSCATCQRMKSSWLRPAGLLHPLEPPSRPWQQVTMDFVTGLPAGSSGNDAILVVVDRLTKMAHFAACKTKITAEQTTKLFLTNIVRLHGIPSAISSDRDPRFTSNFLTKTWQQYGTRLHLSTAYHPQSDGQTERTNQTMEQLIRTTCTDPAQWEDSLPLIEFAYNNAPSATATQSLSPAHDTTRVPQVHSAFSLAPLAALECSLSHTPPPPPFVFLPAAMGFEGEARVVVEKETIADPAPLGLAAFALTTYVLCAHNAGWAPDVIWVGLAFFYGGLAQLLAGMWEFKKNNTFGATAFSTYGAFWMGLGFFVLLKILGYVKLEPSDISEALGWFLSGFFIFNSYMTICALMASQAVLLVFVLLELTLLCLFIGNFKGQKAGDSGSWVTAGGYLGILTAAAAWYASGAGCFNAMARRNVLYTGKPLLSFRSPATRDDANAAEP